MNDKLNTEQQMLFSFVENAINRFNEHESYLLQNDLSERCICSKFAIYLQNEVSNSQQPYNDYVVDVEYNRGAKGKDYEPKRLSDNDSPITVDLIVHKRGYKKTIYQNGIREIIGFANLICIEMKKSNDRRGRFGKEKDKERLFTMTRNDLGFGYCIGLMIIANVKKHQKKELIIDEVISDEYYQ